MALVGFGLILSRVVSSLRFFTLSLCFSPLFYQLSNNLFLPGTKKWSKYQGSQTALLERTINQFYIIGCLLINSVVLYFTCFSFQLRFRIEALESTAGFYQKTPRKYNCITFHKASHKVFDFKDDLNLFAVYSCEESNMNIGKQTGVALFLG